MRFELQALVSLYVATYALDYALFVLSWWLLGRGVLGGRIEWEWLLGWALLFLAMLPLRILSTWSAGRIAVAAGGLLKKKLLAGATRLSPDELRADGAGRHLARVFESERVESLALSGGLLSAAASIELLVTLGIMLGGSPLQGVALVLILLVFAIVSHRYLKERRLWTDLRLEISHEGVEKMVGHRTRLAQERPETRHAAEDIALSEYVRRSEKVDRFHGILNVFPRLWLPMGIVAAAWGEPGLEYLAVGLGSSILASRALAKLADGLPDLLDAAIAWHRVAFLFEAASRESGRDATPVAAPNGRPLVEATDVSYSYTRGGREVLKDVGFELSRGERVLLTAPSGGGKSTLVSLLNGLRRPSRGEVLLEGRVATAPQFHENHVFTASMAFNLLMGRAWPPRAEDLREAEALARELGLGELLDKMPAGMNQLVGDTGWQLSHGERSRLFLARALLQPSELVLLDESFAALDPENLRRALVLARRRAETLVVAAHV